MHLNPYTPHPARPSTRTRHKLLVLLALFAHLFAPAAAEAGPAPTRPADDKKVPLEARSPYRAARPAAAPCAATGTILREFWDGIPGVNVSDVPVSTTPKSINYLTLFEAPLNIGDNYATRIRGYLCPPVSGNYTFWIASDDKSELWLGTAADPAGKVRIAAVNDFTASREWGKYPSQQSAPIPLEAGTAYYIEAVAKEATGGDNLAVGWQLPGGIFERPIPGSRLSPFVPEYPMTPAGLKVVAVETTSVQLAWRAATDDVAVTGYDVYNGTALAGTTDGDTTFTVTGLRSGGTFSFSVRARDAGGRLSTPGAAVTATTVPVQTPCTVTGNILREVWTNLAGNAISSIPVNTVPNTSVLIPSFEAPVNIGDNYATRIRGYVCPPVSGNYTFWMTSDDNGELWLSTNADPANKTRIASVTGFTASREWTKFPSQKSALIPLQAGNKYYIEALCKEATGGDNLAVGWQLPDAVLERPIPGNRLSPFVPPYPSAPGNLRATAKTTTTVDLAWEAATDDVGVTGYDVLNGTTLLGSTTGTTFAASGLAAGTTYTFTVKARDADGFATGSSLTTTTVPSAPAGPLFEAESLVAATSEFPKIYNNSGASGGKEVGNNTTTTALTLPAFYAFGDGEYLLSIRYRADENKVKSLIVNGQVTKITLLNSGNGFAVYQQLLPLRANENNTLVLRTEFGDTQGADYDYFRLEPAADVVPAGPVVDDAKDTFAWTDAGKYPGAGFYEYSVNKGQTWQPVTDNPQPVGDEVYAFGAVQVRVKADAAASRPAGYPLSANGAYTISPVPAEPVVPGTVLWRIGRDDNRSAEFADYAAARRTDSLAVPADWNTRSDWKLISKGLKLDKNGALKLTYNLLAIPEFGVELSFRILDAFQSTPQMAVFSNNTLAGMIQIAGLNGNGLTYKFKETYRLYIPKEFLKTGVNELKLEADRGLFADNTGDQYHWWEWDHVTLKTLAEKAREPLHGRYVHLGNDFRSNGEINARNAFLLSKWSGIAYSGNWIRIGITAEDGLTADRRAYLQTLKQLNLVAMPITFPGGFINREAGSGTMTEAGRRRFRQYLADYGDLFAALEISNEPGLFNTSQAGNVAVARMAREEKAVYAPHLKIVAPGWAYWPTNGTPNGWERDPAQRRPIEDLSDLTNGHSYSTSGVGGLGGSLVETLRTYADYTGDGFPKDMAMSETGSNDDATDNARYGTYKNRFDAVFDREMRASIGYVDHIMYHADFDPAPFNMWTADVALSKLNPENARVRPNRNDPSLSRLNTYRRLALAYATHGEPLAYVYGNAAALAGKKAYFRAVNTAALGRSVTGARSDKYLMNFVNFETSTLTMEVKVAMPGGGTYTGDRYGSGDVYLQAHSRVDFGGDTLTFTETLAPGESVQYILNRKETQAPTAPLSLRATPRSFRQVDLSWQPSADNVGVAGYRIYRNGTYLNLAPAAVTFFTDFTVEEATAYSYTVEAFDDSGNQSPRSNPATVTTPAMPVTAGGPVFEAERCIPAGSQFPQAVSNATASNGQMVTNNFTTTRCEIFGFTAVQANYVLTIRYRSTFDSERSVRVNEVLNAGQFSTRIQITNSNNGWKEARQNITLVPGKKNIIAVQVDFGQVQGGEYDYFRLDTGRVAAPQPEWRFVSHTSPAILYTSAFVTNAGGDAHETSRAGENAQMTIKGTGFRWFSNVAADMGLADVYIDNVLDRTVDIPAAALEGPNKLVYEKTGLTDATHTIRIVGKENKRITVSHLEFLGLLGSPVSPGPDLVVTDVKTLPAEPRPGDLLRLVAVVRNRGTLPTPAGITTGVAFSIDGGNVGYSDTYNAAIQPGETVELVQNSDQSWRAPTVDSLTLGAFVNDIGRYAEQDNSNNRLSRRVALNTADGQPPAAPADLAASALTDSTVTLAWTAATDNVAVTGYDVYQDSVKVNAANVTETRFVATGLASARTYRFWVRARDEAGNLSAASRVLVVVTPDTQAPAAPADLAAPARTDSTVTLAWTAATDNVGVAGYDVYRDSVKVNDDPVAETGFTVKGLAASTAYSFHVTATDRAGNASAASAAIAVTTTDTQAPTAPADLTSPARTPYGISLAWTAATDNVGVTAYEVYRDTLRLAVVSGTDYVATGLPAGQGYTFRVRARDAAGNWSAATPELRVMTLPPDSASYEAEAASLYRAAVFSNQPGYSGTGFVKFPSNEGNYVEWTVRASHTGLHRLRFRYANGLKQEQGFALSVNGTTVNPNLVFNFTGSWEQWSFVEATAYLAEGTHRIRLTTTGEKNSNLDLLRVTDPVAPAPSAARTAAAPAPGPAGNRSLPVRVYPNPATDRITIQFTAPSAGKAQVIFTDVLSRSAQSGTYDVQAGPNRIVVPTVALPGGVYLLRVVTGGTQSVQKVRISR